MLSNRMRLGGKRLIDRTTPTEVTPNAYTTSASARPQVLSNGWIVVYVINGTTDLKWYVSKDNGDSFTLLGTLGTGVNVTISIASYGTIIYSVLAYSSTVSLRIFNATDGNGGAITALPSYVATNIDSSQTAMGQCSIAVNPTNGHLTAAWSSKNATYPNSFNIRSAKSVDGGVTWTKQNGTAGIDQIGTINIVNWGLTEPSVIYKTDGSPTIVFVYKSDTSYYITKSNYVGGAWGAWSASYSIYSGSTYTQSSPSATVQRYGANVGRIWVAWEGQDSTNVNYPTIKVKYSDDNGATWVDGGVTGVNITNDNTIQQLPSITSDKLGDTYLVWDGVVTSGYKRARLIKRTNVAWGSIENITPIVPSHVESPSTCDNYYDFEKPLTIWKDLGAPAVKFYGKYYA